MSESEGSSEDDSPSRRRYSSDATPQQKNSVEELNDQELINAVHDKEIELRHLRNENKVFIHYLEDNDPTELEGLDGLVNFAMNKKWEQNSGPFGSVANQDFMRASISSARRSIRLDSFNSMSSMFDGRGPKVNLTMKSEMTLKAMEEIQSKLDILVKKSLRVKRNWNAELEEYSIREKDIRDSIDSFEFNILTQAVDRLTQRIPAEKFIRWLEEWLKSAQLNIEKLRLRTASLKIQYKKVSAILLQRQELGENVHAVDFDQLEIENKHFARRLELKNIQLIELKRMSAGASLVLTNTKKDLRRLQDEYNALSIAVDDKEKVIKATEDEYEKNEEGLEKARHKFNNFKRLTYSYTVPDVMEYIKVKRELNDLRNKMKVWNRRKKIQDITINACLRHMKNITGQHKINKLWLEDLTADSAIDDDIY